MDQKMVKTRSAMRNEARSCHAQKAFRKSPSENGTVGEPEVSRILNFCDCQLRSFHTPQSYMREGEKVERVRERERAHRRETVADDAAPLK